MQQKEEEPIDEAEKEILIKMLARQNFFKEKNPKDVKPTDFKEIIKCLTLERVPAGSIVMTEIDKPDSFYFIVRGEVSIIGRNTEIKDWNGKNKKYKQLLEWKRTAIGEKLR